MTDAHNDSAPPPLPQESSQKPRLVPTGYRQGVITAITVLLGFSLAFWRFWGFESPGRWTAGSLVAAFALLVAVSLQIVALFRALRIEDDDVGEYRKTVRWFLGSAAALIVGLLIAMVDSATSH